MYAKVYKDITKGLFCIYQQNNSDFGGLCIINKNKRRVHTQCKPLSTSLTYIIDMENQAKPQALSGYRSLEDMVNISPPQDNPNLTMWQLWAGDIKDSLRDVLTGYSVDPRDPSKKVQTGKPLMSPEGVEEIMGLTLDFLANKVSFLGNIDEKAYNFAIRIYNLDIVDKIVLKHEEYGIAKDNMSLLVTNLVSFVSLALSQPLGGGIRAFLRTAEQRKYLISTQDRPQEEQKRGFLSFFK